MKLLFSLQYFNPPKGGAETSTQELIKRLSKEHEVIVVSTGNKGSYNFIGAKVIEKKIPEFPLLRDTSNYFGNLWWEKIIDEEIGRNSPDIIVTQLNFTPSTVDAAKKHNKKVIVMLHSYEPFCANGFLETQEKHESCFAHVGWHKKLQYYFIKRNLEKQSSAMQKADLIISNSSCMQRMASMYGFSSEIVYPIVDFEKVKVKDREPLFIRTFKPTFHKGGEIFLKIAKEMPERRFLVTGGGGRAILPQLRKLNNVKIVDWYDDVKDSYRQVKLLIAPVIWPEPFGMATLEAMANSIPVITSGRGGQTEIVGSAGSIIDNPFDIEAWKEEIEKYDDIKFYERMSKLALAQAKKFSPDTAYRNFINLLKRLA